MNKIYLYLSFYIENGDEEELKSFLKSAVPFYLSKYISSVKLLKDYNQKNKFIEIIEYSNLLNYTSDQSRIEKDSRMKKLLVEWRNIISGEPKIEVYEEIVFL